jgi:hypothetical protein
VDGRNIRPCPEGHVGASNRVAQSGFPGYFSNVPNIFAPLVGGIVGTVVMSAFLLFPRWLGIGKIDVIPAVGALVTGKVENALAPGYLIHFASGIVFAYFYWAVLLAMKLPLTWGMFALFGGIHGVVVMLLVSIVVMEHHPIARYHERGPMTGLAQLIAHILYGVSVGLVVQALH